MTVRVNYDDSGDPASGSRDDDKFYASDAKEHAEAINANTAARTISGEYASRPAAASTNNGAHYKCTNTDKLYKSDGSAWTLVGLGGSHGVIGEPPTGLSTTAMGSAAFTADKGDRVLSMPTSDGEWRVEYAALSPTSNYTATAHIGIDSVANSCIAGIVVMASNGTTLIGFGPGDNNTSAKVFVFGTAALTTIAASVKATVNPYRLPSWFRIRDDGTNNNFEYSDDGLTWALAHAEARTSYLTPAYIGWGAHNNASGARVARCRSFRVTAP